MKLRPPQIFIASMFLAMLELSAPRQSDAENWPMWRGAGMNGKANEPNAPLQWSETENITWKTAIRGKGSSTPVVWGDLIFLTSQTEDEQEWVIAVERGSGKIAWERKGGKGMTKTRAGANMASASSATDGEIVVSTFGTGELIAHDLKGNEVWRHDLQQDHGKFTIWWGYSNSPVIHKDVVILTTINEGPSYVLALDKKTGVTKWKTERKTEAKSEPCDSYATPIVYSVGDRTEVLVTGALWATAYDAGDGHMIWKANIGGDRTILSPVFDDGIIYDTAGKRGPLHAIRAGGNGDVTATNILWRYEKGTPDVPSPVADGPYVYLVNDSGIAICVAKKDGQALYFERLGGDFKSSPVIAANRIYFTNQEGTTTVVELGDKFKVLATNKISGGAMSSLAFSDGQILQRSVEHLYCIGSRSK